MIELLLRLPLLLALLPGVCWSTAVEPMDIVEPSIQIHDQDGTLMISVSYRVPVSPRIVWSVLTDFEHMAGFVPNLESSKVLKRSGQTLLVEQKGSVELGMLPIHYESTRQINVVAYQSIRSQTLSGDTRLESVTVLSPAAEGTLLSYRASAATELPVPNSVVSSYLDSMLKSQFMAMGREMIRRAQLQSDGGNSPQPAEQTEQRAVHQAADSRLAKATAKPAIVQGKASPKKIPIQTKKRPG